MLKRHSWIDRNATNIPATISTHRIAVTGKVNNYRFQRIQSKIRHKYIYRKYAHIMNNPESIKLVDAIKQANLGDKIMDGSAMCAAKWIHFYIHLKEGIVKSCHNVPQRFISQEDLDTYGKNVFMNHPYEIERRKEKLKNIKHSDCSACWRNEERGIRSPRLPKKYYDFHRERFNNPEDELQPLPSQLEVYFNNTCDLKCQYCNDVFSSQWEIENKKYEEAPRKKHIAPNGLEKIFYQWLEEDAVESILQYYILGGEPLIQNEVYDYIDKLISLFKKKSNKFNIRPVVIVISNGNTPEAYLKKWFEKAKQIEPYASLQMDISMESYGKKAEFIRTNLNWERFSNNVNSIMEFAKGRDFRLRFSTTHSALSITSCLDFLKWLKALKDKNEIEVDLIRSNVSYPVHLSPWMLTEQYGRYIDEIVQWIDSNAPEWKDYGQFMLSIKNSFGKHSNSDRVAVIDWVERTKIRRNMDLLEYFPELEPWYKYCRNHD